MSSERVPLNGNLTNTVVRSPNLYTGEIEWSSFDYKLSTAVCVFFTALFAISFVLRVGQAIKSKRWFLLYTLAAAAAAETLGWAFRVWAAIGLEWSPLLGGDWTYPDPTLTDQIAVLIIAPAFSTAANYTILGLLVSLLGQRYCRLAPRSKSTSCLFVLLDLS
ncbi:hypothetical protein BDY24DRAFT_226613 [Mrakia frigida]|uniref:uncharacterized protein n=1 Tax=Mrakia frigida TaxID=29902 RepID=UPI003FCC20E1